MPDYFAILGLAPTASLDEVKRSFRKLAKEYHPDLNKNPGSRERFMQIHEAYEYLSSDFRRQYHREDLLKSKVVQSELKRREEFYRQWVERQRRAAQMRASQYAGAAFDDYKKSRIYRAAMGVSKAYNYLFIALCLLMIIVPVASYIGQNDYGANEQKPIFHFVIPVVVGLIFAFYGYYYLFIQKVDND